MGGRSPTAKVLAYALFHQRNVQPKKGRGSSSKLDRKATKVGPEVPRSLVGQHETSYLI